MRFIWMFLVWLVVSPAFAAPSIVAAENMYGDIARQVAGPGARVTAILDNPDEDPHLFEASATVARALSGADIVIYNGAGYDPWMRPLITATGGGGVRRVIDVADLVHAGTGGNPHLWYGAGTMATVARAVAAALSGADRAGRAGYEARLSAVEASLAVLDAQVAAIAARHRGQEVAGTEPVFGSMVDALGLVDRDMSFQRAIMNDTEPSAADTASIETDLRHHKVLVLLRNSQTDDDVTRRLVAIARESHVPVVPVTETEPAHIRYQDWVAGELDALDRALPAR